MIRRSIILAYLMLMWFVISFVTNIFGPLMPTLIKDFHLSLGMAGFLPFSFFLAYGVVSIPAGILVENYGGKIAILTALVINLGGALLFACVPVYAAALAALFMIGAGMAMLQVVINPLMRTTGGEPHFAFYSVMGQLVFGLASFLSPKIFSLLMNGFASGSYQMLLKLLPLHMEWISFYWLFALMFMVMLTLTAILPLPNVDMADDERSGTGAVYLTLLKNRQVQLFFIGIAAYVGTEQSLADWMSLFLNKYHGLSTLTYGDNTVALFWGLMSVGCLVGLALLKLLDSRLVLRIFTGLAMVSVCLALFGNTDHALLAFPAAGFFLSVMFSVVFSLALNSLPTHHGAFSGILCSGILGGALVPLLVGVVGDHIGLRYALLITLVTLSYIFSIGLWARPLINNATMSIKQLLGQQQQS